MQGDIEFWKMQGAGNDFILIDDRAGRFPECNTPWIQALCTRRTGIGSDGIILLRRSETADFRMLFFNPDGGTAAMCGNGARCAARLALELRMAPNRMRIETGAGIIHAQLRADGVRLALPTPSDWRLNETLDLETGAIQIGFMDTGVPHVVIETDDLDNADVAGMGQRIRHHTAFAPEGTNVNFWRQTGPSALSVRTYERGVEGETLACGTGITACALVAGLLERVRSPVSITSAGGHTLRVDFVVHDNQIRSVGLFGPAEHVFRGTVHPDQP